LPQTDFGALIKISAVFRGGWGVLPGGWNGEHVSCYRDYCGPCGAALRQLLQV